jgi:vacuolar-type H+-ATPase subunit I/STV1
MLGMSRPTPAAVRLLLAALWAGAIWAVSYLAAPSAFAVLDSTRAGDVVGVMLSRLGWLAIVAAGLLTIVVQRSSDLDAGGRRARVRRVGAMLVCSLLVQFGLQPWMASIREAAGPAGVRASNQWGTFAALHGVSQVLYLLESILGAILVVSVGWAPVPTTRHHMK